MAFVFVIIGGVAALFFSLVFWPDLMIAPGKLMHGHASFSKDCFACHVPFRGTPSEKCLSCHSRAIQPSATTKANAIRAGKPLAAFHNSFANKPCVSCHGDHEGMKVYRADLR